VIAESDKKSGVFRNTTLHTRNKLDLDNVGSVKYSFSHFTATNSSSTDQQESQINKSHMAKQQRVT
jgi:alanine racemase